MEGTTVKTLSLEDACRQLNVAAGASESQVRLAYLEQVRLHPPDRDPDEFEKIRDAYNILRDPRTQAAQVLLAPSPMEPLSSLIAGTASTRRFVGVDPWLELLKEKRV